MKLSDIAEQIAKDVGYAPEAAQDILTRAVSLMVQALDRGEEVKIRGLGKLAWAPVKHRRLYDIPRGFDTYVPAGQKLKFYPATKFKTRRAKMPDKDDEGMTKYAVVTDDKEKTASKGDAKPACPICLSELDAGGACPKHGTEPFESHGE